MTNTMRIERTARVTVLFDKSGDIRRTIPCSARPRLPSRWIIDFVKKVTTPWRTVGGVPLEWEGSNESLNVNEAPQLRYDLFTATLAYRQLTPRLVASVFKNDGKYYAYRYNRKKNELEYLRSYDTLDDAQRSIEVLALVWIANGE